MNGRDQTEVLVVGAGPVGMFLALLLAEYGIRVKLIDQESGPSTHSYSCALHPRTFQLFDHAGLTPDVLELGHFVDNVAFYHDGHRCAELKLAPRAGESSHVVVLPQNTLESLLERRLRQFEHVEVNWNCRLSEVKFDGNGVVASIDKLTESAKGYAAADWDAVVDKTIQTRADFLIGADGHNSQVRQCLGIEYDTVGAPELFVIYQFQSDETCGHEMKIVLSDKTVSAMWPLAANQCRWSFQINPADARADFPGKDRSPFTIEELRSENDSQHHLQDLLKRRAPWFAGTVKQMGWSTDLQIERRLARQFGRNRCWLAGDAAHQTGPIGMQSMNVGLREAADLAVRLKKILREKASEDLLQTYNADRRTDWQRLLGLDGAPTPAPDAAPWLKKHAAQIPSLLPASGEDLALLLSRLGLSVK